MNNAVSFTKCMSLVPGAERRIVKQDDKFPRYFETPVSLVQHI